MGDKLPPIPRRLVRNLRQMDELRQLVKDFAAEAQWFECCDRPGRTGRRHARWCRISKLLARAKAVTNG